jgi:predicted acetyltransferase
MRAKVKKNAFRAVSAGCIHTERVDMTKDSKNQLGVYSVISDEGGRDVWVEIGSATPHHEGEGFDLTLRALPLASRLVLRERVEDDSRDETREESQKNTQDESLERSQGDPKRIGALSLASQMKEFERAAIQRCLLETGGNIGAALKRLKIPRRTLNEKMVRLGIDRRSLKLPHLRIVAKTEHANPESESMIERGEPGLFLERPRWGKNGATNGK